MSTTDVRIGSMLARVHHPTAAAAATKAPAVILMPGSAPLPPDDARNCNAFTALSTTLASQGYAVLVTSPDDELDPMPNLMRVRDAAGLQALADKTLVSAPSIFAGEASPPPLAPSGGIRALYVQGADLEWADVKAAHSRVLSPAFDRARNLSILGRSHPSWRSRCLDGAAAIDCVASGQLEQLIPELRGRLDRTAIAVGGHSKGSFGAMLLAGCEGVGQSFADPRVKACLLLSPDGSDEAPPHESLDEAIAPEAQRALRAQAPGALSVHIIQQHVLCPAYRGLRDDAWDNMRAPLLVVNGDEDISPGAGQRGMDWRREPFTRAGSQTGRGLDAYMLELQGVGHDLAGVAIPSVAAEEKQAAAAELVTAAALAFLDSELLPRGSERQRDAAAWLRRGPEPNAALPHTWETKRLNPSKL